MGLTEPLATAVWRRSQGAGWTPQWLAKERAGAEQIGGDSQAVGGPGFGPRRSPDRVTERALSSAQFDVNLDPNHRGLACPDGRDRRAKRGGNEGALGELEELHLRDKKHPDVGCCVRLRRGHDGGHLGGDLGRSRGPRTSLRRRRVTRNCEGGRGVMSVDDSGLYLEPLAPPSGRENKRLLGRQSGPNWEPIFGGLGALEGTLEGEEREFGSPPFGQVDEAPRDGEKLGPR